MTGAARHPEQDHAFLLVHGPAGFGCFRTCPQQTGQRQSADARETGFQHAATIDNRQTFPSPAIEVHESMRPVPRTSTEHIDPVKTKPANSSSDPVSRIRA